jgi:hypothetical protein
MRTEVHEGSRVGRVLPVVLLLASSLALTHADGAAPGTSARAATPGVLVVARFGKTGSQKPAKIVVARADGSGSRVLTTGWIPSVSPDGLQVAVLDSDVNWYTNQRLELYASSGGTPRSATPLGCFHVYWSPDSTKLACVEFVGENKPRRLRLIDAAAGTRTTLATGFFDSQLSFSPDSTSLAYVQRPKDITNRGSLRVMDLAARAVRTLRSGNLASPAWGPDTIAFGALKPRGFGTFTTSNVALIQPDGSGFRKVTDFRPDAELFGPSPVVWSVDGKRLLAGMTGRDAWVARESYAVDPIRGGVRLIAHQVSPSVLTRDGRYVIGHTGDEATSGLDRSNVVRVPWGGGAKRILLRQAVEPSLGG